MAAAYGGGGLLGAGAAAFGVAFAQGLHARNQIGVRRHAAPYADGLYGARQQGTSERFAMLGDSLAAGGYSTSMEMKRWRVDCFISLSTL